MSRAFHLRFKGVGFYYFFGLSDGYWLRAQAAYDTELEKEKLKDELKSMRTWQQVAACV